MKTFVFFIGIFLAVMFSNSAMAQEGDMGSDPDKCMIMLSTYNEFVNQQNYKDAMPAWRWCFKNCPAATRNIYIHGTSIVEYFIEQQTDNAAREAYIDTLMMVFDNRIKYYNQEALVLGRKGISMLKYRNEQVKEANKVLRRSFELGRESSEYFVLQYLMQTTVILYGSEAVTKEEVVTTYSDLSDVINTQIENEASESKKARLEETAKNIEELFVNSGAADCATIIKLFGPKFEENPEDISLAVKILALLDRGQSDECKLSDLYMKCAIATYNAEKTSNSAHSIAQSYFKRSDVANAEKFYEEAISLEENSLKKADMYYELALLYYSNKNYAKSRQAARNALVNNSNYGKAYILIGKLYAAGGSCGETVVEKKSLNCLIVDQFIKAKNVDESVAQEANELIYRYSAAFPTNEELFWENYKEGQTITIGCWIGESTTLRAKKGE
ncbi:MAG TPA: tetratricopeptide repeat protein [Bacteroidales bacterium]|nr:tetratricopeptide repeat protein [Bacteroidales bacterium]HQB21427.1 tetratricopeptide repeat protein [Bacteroidales bacterium]